MVDEVETADGVGDGQKGSRRQRWKGALQRTKSKFKKREDEDAGESFSLSEDVDRFLHPEGPSTSGSADALPAHPSPRRVQVPRIDITASQRWPAQKVLGNAPDDKFLHPIIHGRSQSQGSLERRKTRPRNLSVSFLDAPPLVIGEGGDEAEQPPSEMWKSRARSVSPMPYRFAASEVRGNEAAVRRKPVAAQDVSSSKPLFDDVVPQPQRWTPNDKVHCIPPPNSSAFDEEFEMTLKPGPAFTRLDDSLSQRGNAYSERPPDRGHSLTPNILEPELPDGDLPILKPVDASTDLRMQFQEGRALRQAYDHGPSTSPSNEYNSRT